MKDIPETGDVRWIRYLCFYYFT